MWYGLDHQPISLEEASRLLGDAQARIVAQDPLVMGSIGLLWVSTVFLVLDYNPLGIGLPVLYETMVFGEDGEPLYQRRYCTREDALAGHQEALDTLSRDVAP